MEGDPPAATSDVTTGCTRISSGSAWWNQSFGQQTGKFHVTFSATPSADNVDAVVGFSNGAASSWTKLAAIVRFSPDGVIDVRKGSTYAADQRAEYRGGQSVSFRVDIDVKAHIYSVYLNDWSGNFSTALATNYPFRTEQASVTSLNNTASFLEPSRAGSLDVCGLTVIQDDSFANDCVSAAGGGTFSNMQLDATSGVLMTHFTATPSQSNMDGVVGFASGKVDAYNDYAASIRFWTNGMIEARDGDTYRASQPFAYQAGTRYVFHAIIDIPSKTYSVEVAPLGEGDFIEIARAFKFRPQQLGITSLDHASAVVASSSGRVDACALRNETWPGLKIAHRGYASIHPLASGKLVMSDATQTWIADGNGVTLYTGAPPGLVATNGAQDTLYIASAANGVLTVSAYSMTLVRQWTKTYAIEGEAGPIGVFTDGTIAIAINKQRLVTFYPDGSIGDRRIADTAQTGVAISPWGYGLVSITPDGLTLGSYTPDGRTQWQRFWNGSFSLENFVPNMGAFVLTGQFYTTVNFGDGAMEPFSNPDTSLNTFLLSVNANGLVTFSKRLWSSYSTGLATNGTDIAVSTMRWTQAPRLEFSAFDRTGAGLVGLAGDTFYGFTQGIAITPSRRTLVNMAPTWGPSAASGPWDHVFGFDPP